MASTKSKPCTDWLELPSDIMANILHRVGVVDIFENVQKVCTTWLKICKDHPALWRVIQMDAFLYQDKMPRLRLEKICKIAVNRSQGQLVDFTVVGFDNDEILRCIADRSSQLRRLETAYCSFKSWNEALKKFPLLEELNLYETTISKEAIEIAGRYCPMLKTLRVNRKVSACEDVEGPTMMDNEFAKAVGGNLVELRHLELIGCSMSNVGLQVILDGCCHLESLDLRGCWCIGLNKDRLKRCLKQIKHLKLPNDSLEDCPYLNKFSDVDEYDYPYWDEYDPVFSDHEEREPVFEEYDIDAYVDYYYDLASRNPSYGR